MLNLKKLVLEALNEHNIIKEKADELNNMSEDEQVAYIQNNPTDLIHISHPSEKVLLAAISSGIENIGSYVLNYCRLLVNHGDMTEPSYEVKKAAIANDGCAIRNLRAGEQTPELQQIAVSNCRLSPMYIWGRLDPVAEKIGFEKYGEEVFGTILKNREEKVLERKQKRELNSKEEENPYYKQFIAANKDLSVIPEEERTYRMCFEAVKNNPQQLQFVPESIKDLKICYYAAWKDSSVLKWVPKDVEKYQDIVSDAGIGN